MAVRIKRAYESFGRTDGYRVLIDRIWPRGVSKEEARLDEWARELAPSTELRRWFGHDPARWDEFRQRYAAELDDTMAAVAPLLERRGTVTLLFSAHDAEHNNAVALAAWLAAQNSAS